MTPPIDPSPLAISLATTCAATMASFFLGLFAARRMYAMLGSLRTWIDGILTLPLVLPPTVVGFFLLLIFGRCSALGLLLEQVGVTVVFSWPGTVIAATVVAFPLMYRTSLGALELVNPTLLEAARTLGASEGRVFRRVLLPLAAPGVVAGSVLAFARALGEFGATLMLAGNIPGRTQTMPIAITGSLRAAGFCDDGSVDGVQEHRCGHSDRRPADRRRRLELRSCAGRPVLRPLQACWLSLASFPIPGGCRP